MRHEPQTHCKELSEPLSLLASGDLPDSENQEVLAHLAICDECRRRWSQLTDVVATLRVKNPEWLDLAVVSVIDKFAFKLEDDHQLKALPDSDVGLSPTIFSAESKPAAFRAGGKSLWWGGVIAAAIAWIVLSSATLDWTWLGLARISPSDRNSNTGTGLESVTSTDVGISHNEFATWWELDRSLAESEVAFDRTLGRGPTGGIRTPLGMKELLKELVQ